MEHNSKNTFNKSWTSPPSWWKDVFIRNWQLSRRCRILWHCTVCIVLQFPCYQERLHVLYFIRNSQCEKASIVRRTAHETWFLTTTNTQFSTQSGPTWKSGSCTVLSNCSQFVCVVCVCVWCYDVLIWMQRCNLSTTAICFNNLNYS